MIDRRLSLNAKQASHLPPWPMAVYYKIQRVFESQFGKAELQNAATRGALLDAGDVEREWTATFAGVRARMLAVPSRAAQRLPHLGAHDVSEIDREVRDALAEVARSGDKSPPTSKNAAQGQRF
jgi:phage terminase Nu1 subunit (DNA packaging protein)